MEKSVFILHTVQVKYLALLAVGSALYVNG